MRYDQLPAKLRAQADQQLGKTKAKRVKATASGPGLPLTCSRCPFSTDKPTEGRLDAHADTHPGGCRYEWRPEVNP